MNRRELQGPIAMERGFLSSIMGLRQQLVARGGGEDDFSAGDPDAQMTEDGIAVIECVGAISKYGMECFGGIGTIAVGDAVATAAADPGCVGIVMRIDSPGGFVDGVQDCSMVIASASNKKPIWCSVEGGLISAAYWLACGCSRIIVSAGSLVGGIGTCDVLYDRSKQFELNGIKTIVVRAGEHKGAATAGEKISKEQIADRLRVINEINDLFVADVARGRRVDLKTARAMADGRVYAGANAKARGLVDQVGGFDEAMAGIRKVIGNRRHA